MCLSHFEIFVFFAIVYYVYRNILVIVNEHTYSEAAATYAVHLSRICKAKLFIFSCLPSGVSKEKLLKTESQLNRIFTEAGTSGLTVESIIERGHFFDKLENKIDKEKIDLVFYPLAKNSYYEIPQFDKRVPVNLCLVRVVNMAKPHPNNILIPLRGKIENFDDWSYFTATLCKAFKSKATVLHITTRKIGFTGKEILLKLIDLHKNIPDDIANFVSTLEQKGVTIKKRFAQGMIGRSITIEAATKKNDLIIMGLSKRSALKKLLTEDPTAFVLKETPCNIIIFRAKKI